MNSPRIVSTLARLLTLGPLLAALGTQARAETDPLPSWNDGPAKEAIVAFVKETGLLDNHAAAAVGRLGSGAICQ